MNKRNTEIGFGITLVGFLTLLLVLVDVAAFIALVCVAWHFIAKYW